MNFNFVQTRLVFAWTEMPLLAISRVNNVERRVSNAIQSCYR